MTGARSLVGPVVRLLGGADELLRGPVDGRAPLAQVKLTRLVPRLLAMIVLFGALYGAVMGGFGAWHPGHLVQVGYAAIKVPMLLTVSFCISLPSFLVLNTLLGVRADVRDVLHALLSMQAGLTIVLASLAPFTAFWYASFAEYQVALVFNGVMFAVATGAAQWILRRAYRPLIQRNPRHRTLLRVWGVIYAFVAIQMAWVLRPFVGDPSGPITFFRREAWGNAYVEVVHIVLRALGV